MPLEDGILITTELQNEPRVVARTEQGSSKTGESVQNYVFGISAIVIGIGAIYLAYLQLRRMRHTKVEETLGGYELVMEGRHRVNRLPRNRYGGPVRATVYFDRA
jgi:hypothetical protein